MADGINLDGFTAPKINPTSPWPAASQSPASGGSFGAGLSWPAAQDMSTQGNAGFNAEGSYDTGTRGGETNAYPESENM